MSDGYYDIPNIEEGELDRPTPTYDKYEGEKKAEQYRKRHLERFGRNRQKNDLIGFVMATFM